MYDHNNMGTTITLSVGSLRPWGMVESEGFYKRFLVVRNALLRRKNVSVFCVYEKFMYLEILCKL